MVRVRTRDAQPDLEKRFDLAAWLILGLVLAFSAAAVGSTLAILRMPTDGWQVDMNNAPPFVLGNFSGSWPTPLRKGDQVLAVNVAAIGWDEYARMQDPAWQVGQTVTYRVQRGAQTLDIAVELHRLTGKEIWESVWFSARGVYSQWSWLVIALLVFLLRPRSPAARLMFLAFVPFDIVFKIAWAGATVSQHFAPPVVFYIYQMVNAFWGVLFFPSLILLGLSFPSPIFPLTRWPRGVPAVLYGLPLALMTANLFLRKPWITQGVQLVESVLLFLAFGLALVNARRQPLAQGSQAAVMRAQATWVIFGFVLSVVPIFAGYLLYSSGIIEDGSVFFNPFTILVLPVCLAIAITRYHLFDVYVIIRRTIQYSLLTVLLALVYLVGVVSLQSLFRLVTGQGQDLAIVVSTLGIAALFQPLRQRVQGFIDRRFFRGKYDAQTILAGFSDTSRKEVALEPLSTALVSAIEETMQPQYINLWLKETKNS